MDLVIRAAVAFFFVFLLTRVIGRRELSSLQPFDLIMLVMIGDLVQQGVTQNDFSVTALCSSAARSACSPCSCRLPATAFHGFVPPSKASR